MMESAIYVFHPADAPAPREVLTNKEGFVEGDPEGRTPERYPHAGALSGSTRIAHQNVIRGDRRG